MWALENKWVRWIFNKYQITKEIQEGQTVPMLSQCSKKDSAMADKAFSMESVWGNNRKTSERLNL